MSQPNDFKNDGNDLYSSSDMLRKSRMRDYDDESFADEEVSAGFEGESADNGVSEGIRAMGERFPVERDERSVSDDAVDYRFPKHKKKRGTSHSGYIMSSELDPEADPELEKEGIGDFVLSDRSHSRHHHSSHHHSSHHHSSGHHKSRRKKKMKTWKKVLLIIGIVLLSLILIAVGTGAFLIYQGQRAMLDNPVDVRLPDDIEAKVDDTGDYITYKGKKYEYNKNITNMLFMGVDKNSMDERYEGGGNGQADVIAIAAFDTKTDKCTVVNLPRDTMTDVPVYSEGIYAGMQRQQICLAYAYGDTNEQSCQNTMTSVARIFYNLPISTYFALDLDGVVSLNDAVGGVDVVSPETIAEFVEGESYHLEGIEAEHFVRKRSMEQVDANLKRNKRQQIYATEFVKKVVAATKKDITVPVSLFNASSPYSCTDLDPSRISYLAKEIVTGNGLKLEIKNVDGKMTYNEKEQHAEFNIDEQKFFEQFLEVFYVEKK